MYSGCSSEEPLTALHRKSLSGLVLAKSPSFSKPSSRAATDSANAIIWHLKISYHDGEHTISSQAIASC